MDLWVLREQLPGNPVRAIEPASGRVGLEAGPRGLKVALGTTRVCELGPLSHHLFQGLFSPLVCALVDLSPQHSFWRALFTPLDPFPILPYPALWASLVAQQLKKKNNKKRQSTCNAGDLSSIPELEDPLEEETASIPLQNSCLENPTDRGACWATVPGVAKSWTQLSN